MHVVESESQSDQCVVSSAAPERTSVFTSCSLTVAADDELQKHVKAKLDIVMRVKFVLLLPVSTASST